MSFPSVIGSPFAPDSGFGSAIGYYSGTAKHWMTAKAWTAGLSCPTATEMVLSFANMEQTETGLNYATDLMFATAIPFESVSGSVLVTDLRVVSCSGKL